MDAIKVTLSKSFFSFMNYFTIRTLAYILMTGILSLSTVACASVEQSLPFKRIKFGFNISYLVSTPKFKPALEQLLVDGHDDIRVFETYTKGISDNPEFGLEQLKWLDQKGFSILLSISNFPFEKTNRQEQLSKMPKKHRNYPKRALTFTNRFPPSDFNKYSEFLTDYLSQFDEAGILDRMQFEIGNEPNAAKFFWGNSQDWENVKDVVSRVLKKYNKQALCCAYTSTMFFQRPIRQHHKDFISDYLKNAKNPDRLPLSFHLYLSTSFGKADLENPVLNPDGGIITEYGMFSNYNKTTSATKNSSAYLRGIAELLEFSYKQNIEKVYMFPLMDDVRKVGSMGYFDNQGNAKNSYRYFSEMWDIVRDGYKVIRDDNRLTIKGKNSELTVTSNRHLN